MRLQLTNHFLLHFFPPLFNDWFEPPHSCSIVTIAWIQGDQLQCRRNSSLQQALICILFFSAEITIWSVTFADQIPANCRSCRIAHPTPESATMLSPMQIYFERICLVKLADELFCSRLLSCLAAKSVELVQTEID